MRHAIETARRLGHTAIILLGDAPYYARFGFQAEKAAELHLPGSFERERLLGLELTCRGARRRLGHDRADRQGGDCEGSSHHPAQAARDAGGVRRLVARMERSVIRGILIS